MWLCPNCNETMPDEVETCYHCGRRREEILNERPQSAPENSGLEGQPAPPVPGPPLPAMSADGMNRREIAAVVSRSVALVILAQVAYSGATLLGITVYSLAAASDKGSFNWSSLSSAILPCVLITAGSLVAMVYWKKAPAIAARMTPENLEPVTASPSFGLRDVMVVAFSTAGLFVFLDGIRELVGVLYLAQLYDCSLYELFRVAALWSSGAQLALALWLILGSRGICGAIHWIRTAGVPDFDQQPEAAGDDVKNA